MFESPPDAPPPPPLPPAPPRPPIAEPNCSASRRILKEARGKWYFVSDALDEGEAGAKGTHSGSAMRAAMSGMPPPAPPAPPPSPPIIC